MRKKFLVPSDLSWVQKTSKKTLAFLKPLSLSKTDAFDIRLCLEEALINAIKYGNCLEKNLKVGVTVEYDQKHIRLVVEDQGSGFNTKEIIDCTQKHNLLKCRGRGIFLIRRLMNRVRYNTRGNRILMVKSLRTHKGGGHGS